jgi:hypothetical protein
MRFLVMVVLLVTFAASVGSDAMRVSAVAAAIARPVATMLAGSKRHPAAVGAFIGSFRVVSCVCRPWRGWGERPELLALRAGGVGCLPVL